MNEKILIDALARYSIRVEAGRARRILEMGTKLPQQIAAGDRQVQLLPCGPIQQDELTGNFGRYGQLTVTRVADIAEITVDEQPAIVSWALIPLGSGRTETLLIWRATGEGVTAGLVLNKNGYLP
jgi:hypothetical protein